MNPQSPKDELVLEIQNNEEEQTDLQKISEEQQNEQMLKETEIQRQLHIKKIQLKIKRQLSTILEISGQQSDISQSPQPKSVPPIPKQKIRKNRYRSSFDLKRYYRDGRIDLSWKLLFSYFTLLIICNIILNIIELIRYQYSLCRLYNIDNTVIFVNQIFYIFGKIGIISLLYQEFTHTLPTQSKIPLLHPVLFNAIFPVVSMPLYVFDFIKCEQRSLFTLRQSIETIKLLDYFLFIIVFLVIVMNTTKMFQNTTIKRLNKVIKLLYKIILAFFQITALVIYLSQPHDQFLPALILENFYFLFTIATLIYLSILKFCFNKQPFEFHPENTNQIIDEKLFFHHEDAHSGSGGSQSQNLSQVSIQKSEKKN
ncbi:hypothetical protein pb186bvf_006095 [Paramecium bursaria]